jgi:hypothetical protein
MAEPAHLLPKMLGMLGHENDHQVLVAARKIHSLVVTNDLDWHQLLANGSAHALTEAQMQKIYQAGLEAGESDGYARGYAEGEAAAQQPVPPPKPELKFIGNDISWGMNVVKAGLKAVNDARLSSSEADFVESLQSRFDMYGRRAFFTDRQKQFLMNIEAKLQRLGYL